MPRRSRRWVLYTPDDGIQRQGPFHVEYGPGHRQFPTFQFRKIDAPRAFRRGSSNGAAILEKPVSDRGTLEDLSQSPLIAVQLSCKLLILNGEMSEWSIEHAWKAKRASELKRLETL